MLEKDNLKTMRINKIHFLGLSDALKPLFILEKLLRGGFFTEKEIVFIGDKKEGRVMDFCRRHGLKTKVFEDVEKETEGQRIDLLMVIGWSYLLTENILKLYTYALNCHGGLLPDYWGNNTYMHSYANIAEEYGVTIHFINDSFDDGNILLQGSLQLFKEETPLMMHKRICEIASFLIPSAVYMLERGELGVRQKGTARYFFKISREEMNRIRSENEKRLQENIPLKVCRNKTWILE